MPVITGMLGHGFYNKHSAPQMAAVDYVLSWVDRAETYEVPVPFAEEFRMDGDADRYASEYTNFFRAFTEPVVRSSFYRHRSLDALVTDIYKRAERLVREEPQRYEFHYIAIAALMTRR